MSWIPGTIEEFKGSNPKNRDLRKIRTRPDQEWEDRYFFRVSWARAAGYPDSALTEGQPIEFEPDPRAAQPKVLRFKPYQPTATPARTFLNPYHFVPLAPPQPPLADAETVLRGTLHDRFDGDGVHGPRRYSGRIVCRLETEGPVVVGAEQRHVNNDPEQERVIHPFGLPDPAAPDDPYRRTPMIPGSTLRGLISSIVEASSCSTLRVLEEREFTRRAAIKERALSAVGLLVEEEGELKLRPLTFSVQEMTQVGREDPPRDRCRVLLNAYRFNRSQGCTEYSAGSFLDRRRPLSWSSSHQELWYQDLQRAHWHWKERKSTRFLLGLMADEPPISEKEWAALPEPERKRYTRGFLLVLGIEGGKAGNLPPDKKHEYFIPYPENRKWGPALQIPRQVLEEFQHLAQEAAKISRGGEGPSLPFLHAGRARDRNGIKPQPGDLVYFEIEAPGQISRISYSALWRRPIQGTIHGAVGLVSKDLVPLHKGRTKLTLAEELFGFVEKDGKRALAGRLRFSHALVEEEAPNGDWYDVPVLLQILASPKPPSAALYFGNQGYLAKQELDLNLHSPQGRKFYLHHREQDLKARSYESHDPEKKKLKLKARVRPLKEKIRFVFHVDFENLTGKELGHLLYALRPTQEFRHKVGMAKPLGLGRIRIDPLAVCFIDRRNGYGPESLFGPKYRWVESQIDAEEWRGLSSQVAHRYRREAEAVGVTGMVQNPFPSLKTLVEEVKGGIPEKVREALELLGNPDKVHTEVSYPVLQLSATEGEHFQWFVANDKHEMKSLAPLDPKQGLPTLERYEPR